MPRWKDTNTVVTRICHNSSLQSLNKVNFMAFTLDLNNFFTNVLTSVIDVTVLMQYPLLKIHLYSIYTVSTNNNIEILDANAGNKYI